MFTARNRNAVIADDTFQVQDWLRSNGNHDRGYPEFDYQHRIRPLSPVKRRRIFTTDGRGPDHRKQLKSMESLLGLSDENLNGKNLSTEAFTRASPDVQDSLDRALMDFEETLELAFQSNSIVPPPRGFSNHNLVEGDESNYNKLDSSFESNTTGSSGYSTKPDQSVHRSINNSTYNELQLIREQMVKSLEIIKDLEEQVKLVPMLKAQVSSLNLEKQRLSSELDKHKKMENANKSTTGLSEWRSFTLPTNKRTLTGVVTTKDVGVNCVAMCRDVGVTTPATATLASASTMTDRPANEAASFDDDKPATTAAYTQTTTAATVAVVTPAAVTVVPVTVDVGTQSVKPVAIRTATVGVSVKPRMYDACMTAKPTTKHVGCSADILAEVKPVAAAPVPVAAAPVPVAAAPVPVTRTTQTDIMPTIGIYARGTQTTMATLESPSHRPSINRTTQTVNDHRAPSPAVVAVVERRHRTTQTDVLATATVAIQKSDNTGAGGRPSSNPKVETGSGRPVAATIGRRSNSFHHYTAAVVTQTTSPGGVTSKIPRLKPVTPELNRKTFNRQDTYTKTAPEICSEHPPLSSPLSLNVTSRENYHDNVKSKEPLSPAQEIQNGLPESDMNFEPIRDDVHKDNPSKEMKAALKVLNDSLKKTSATLLPRVQLKQAIDVVREEWFKVTSSSDCSDHHVKNYVKSFTSYSPVLLEFIINMTDAAGNTVLHYAISHGNFDVVSSILDTGVCNVNLTNDAGYSTIMLVSLADIKNDEEMKIIKRLFKYGDVNLQAKKHGQTTLMLAVSHGKTEVVKLLLECGADLNMQDEDGSTALMCAAEHGLQEIVNILLSCPECDVSIEDNDGSTALSIAMEAGHREIGIALYAKQHILSRENSPFSLPKTKRSRSANTVMQASNMSYSNATLKKSPSLQPRQYATLSSMLKTRIP